jgi:hypothetical protein
MQNRSFKKRLTVTKESLVDYLAKEAKLKPENFVIKQISDKLNEAFSTIQKDKNPLNTPYLVNVFIGHIVSDKTKSSYTVTIDWFEKRFIAHSVMFKNKENLETWVYNFQCDYYNKLNKATKGIRYYEQYQFGIQEKGGTVVSVEAGMKLADIAEKQKLVAVLLDKDGRVISNEMIVDYIEIHKEDLRNNSNRKTNVEN